MRRRSFLAGADAAASVPLLVPGRAVAAPTHDAVPARDAAQWQNCRELARELLLVSPDGEDLKLRHLKILSAAKGRAGRAGIQ